MEQSQSHKSLSLAAVLHQPNTHLPLLAKGCRSVNYELSHGQLTEITDRCSSEEFNVYLLFTVNYYLPNAAAELKD